MPSEKEIKDAMRTMGTLMRRALIRKMESDSAVGEGAMMHYLADNEKATAGELADFLRVGSGRIANLLKASEKKGIIERKRDETDGRRVIVEMTEKGKLFHEKRESELVAIITDKMSVLTDEEFKAFLKTLKKLVGEKSDV